MASYTYNQLYGTGSAGENLSSLKTFIFNNPSASSYFILETIPVTGKGWFDATSPKNFIGTFNATSSMGLVTSSYVAAVVVPPGTSSFAFKPSSSITGTTYRMKGTGMYDLTTFDPTALFASSEKGVWFDANDLSTLFQDAAGTIPVTAVGQKVGKWLDKSGNGFHATQSNAALQPTYQIDPEGNPNITFSGSYTQLATLPINFVATAQMMVSVGLNVVDSASAAAALELGSDVSSINGSFLIGAPSAVADHSLYVRGTTIAIRAAVNNVSDGDDIITGLFDISQTTSGSQLIPRLNFVQLTGSQITWSPSNTATGVGTFGNLPLYIGARSGGTLPFNGKIYQIIVRGALSTAAQVFQTETFIDYNLD
jgi:hypothetical protein